VSGKSHRSLALLVSSYRVGLVLEWAPGAFLIDQHNDFLQAVPLAGGSLFFYAPRQGF
jgi:hypothetical protein